MGARTLGLTMESLENTCLEDFLLLLTTYRTSPSAVFSYDFLFPKLEFLV
jgi:hypothetical protein